MIYKVTETQYDAFLKILQKESEIDVNNYIDSTGVADITKADTDTFNTLLRQYGLNDDIIIVPSGPNDITKHVIEFVQPVRMEKLLEFCDNMLLVKDIITNDVHLAFDLYRTQYDKDTPSFGLSRSPGTLGTYSNLNRQGKTMLYFDVNKSGSTKFGYVIDADKSNYLKRNSLSALFNIFELPVVTSLTYECIPNMHKRIINQLTNKGIQIK